MFSNYPRLLQVQLSVTKTFNRKSTARHLRHRLSSSLLPKYKLFLKPLDLVLQ